MSCEKDTSWLSGRVTFPSSNRGRGPSLSGDRFTLFLIDYGLGIRDQYSGIRDQGTGIRDHGTGIRIQGSVIRDHTDDQ